MFGKVLVANRGEIAIRVLRTARRMGIRTIAIYTDLDRNAPHVTAADEAHLVPNYLDIEAVVAVARRARADAIHPGYGFLSERAAFAQSVENAGLTLVDHDNDGGIWRKHVAQAEHRLPQFRIRGVSVLTEPLIHRVASNREKVQTPEHQWSAYDGATLVVQTHLRH